MEPPDHAIRYALRIRSCASESFPGRLGPCRVRSAHCAGSRQAAKYVRRNHEWRMRPAESFARALRSRSPSGNRGSPRCPPCSGEPKPMVVLAGDQGRAASPWLLDGSGDGFVIMAVDAVDVPSHRPGNGRSWSSEPSRSGAVDGDAVVVEQHDQAAQLEMAGHARRPHG